MSTFLIIVKSTINDTQPVFKGLESKNRHFCKNGYVHKYFENGWKVSKNGALEFYTFRKSAIILLILNNLAILSVF